MIQWLPPSRAGHAVRSGRAPGLCGHLMRFLNCDFKSLKPSASFRVTARKGPVRPLVGATAGRKLYQLNQAGMLRDLALPGNQLEALKGERAGQYSIRVNDQFRVCFIWRDGDACDVEIVDYH